jgi:hypothetical protein
VPFVPEGEQEAIQALFGGAKILDMHLLVLPAIRIVETIHDDLFLSLVFSRLTTKMGYKGKHLNRANRHIRLQPPNQLIKLLPQPSFLVAHHVGVSNLSSGERYPTERGTFQISLASEAHDSYPQSGFTLGEARRYLGAFQSK